MRTQGVPANVTGQLSIAFLLSVYEYEESAENWLDGVPRGKKGPVCPSYGRRDRVQLVKKQKPLRWACGTCRSYFSVRSGNILARTKIQLQNWAIGNYLQACSLKGMSSTKLHGDLEIT